MHQFELFESKTWGVESMCLFFLVVLEFLGKFYRGKAARCTHDALLFDLVKC